MGVRPWLDSMGVQDVERALLVLFRSGLPMTASDMARTMAFGQGWLGIEEADAVVLHLIETGWLQAEGDGYLPSRDLSAVEVPLSWMPRPSRLLDATAPGAAVAASPEPVPPAQVIASPLPVAEPEANESDDPRVRLEGRLVGFIARASGLERAEVKRRAERKQHALRPCTSWLGLALGAHDQGLDMNAIGDALSPNAQA